MEPSPQVSVVVPCVGGADLLSACLATLREALGGMSWEAVVVDNGSPDGGEAVSRAAAAAGARLVGHERNLGFAAGANAGLRAARGGLVMVVNNDTLLAPGCVARMARALAAHPQAGLVGPRSNHVKGRQRVTLGDEGLTAGGRERIAARLASTEGGLVEDVEDLAGLCLLGPAALWEECGGFDERFPVGNFEDDDLCMRLRRAGFRLLIARDAYLHHLGHRTFALLGEDYGRRMAENGETLRRKWAADPLLRGRTALEAGHFQQAFALALEALAHFPAFPDPHLLAARAAERMGQDEVALEHLERFLALCPFHGEAAVARGLLLLRLGREVEALRALRQALATCAVPAPLLSHATEALGRWSRAAGLGMEAGSLLAAGGMKGPTP